MWEKQTLLFLFGSYICCHLFKKTVTLFAILKQNPFALLSVSFYLFTLGLETGKQARKMSWENNFCADCV